MSLKCFLFDDVELSKAFRTLNIAQIEFVIEWWVDRQTFTRSAPRSLQ